LIVIARNIVKKVLANIAGQEAQLTDGMHKHAPSAEIEILTTAAQL